MSDEKSDLILDLVLVLICFFAGSFVGYTAGQSQMRKEAVRNYAAVYIANEDGEPVFTWRTQL